MPEKLESNTTKISSLITFYKCPVLRKACLMTSLRKCMDFEKLTLIAILMLQSLDTSLEEFQPLVLSFFIVMDGSSIRCAITGSRRYSSSVQ